VKEDGCTDCSSSAVCPGSGTAWVWFFFCFFFFFSFVNDLNEGIESILKSAHNTKCRGNRILKELDKLQKACPRPHPPPREKHAVLLVQQIQQLEKCKNSIYAVTRYRITLQKRKLGVTMLCSLEPQCQQHPAFVKNINAAMMYEGDFFFCKKVGVILPLCLLCCQV